MASFKYFPLDQQQNLLKDLSVSFFFYLKGLWSGQEFFEDYSCKLQRQKFIESSHCPFSSKNGIFFFVLFR